MLDNFTTWLMAMISNNFPSDIFTYRFDLSLDSNLTSPLYTVLITAYLITRYSKYFFLNDIKIIFYANTYVY